jgi:hypothetical protein
MSSRFYPGLTAEAVRARAAALERFARWEAHHGPRLSAAAAVAAAGALYDLLPATSKTRPVDPSGVMALHALLARAAAARR